MQNISLARLTHKNNYENNWRQTTIANSFSFHPLEVINQNLQWTADSQQRIVWILLQPWLTGAAAHRRRVCGASRSWLRLVLSTATPCPGEENIWVYTIRHLLSHWNFTHRAHMWHSKSLARLSVSPLAQSRQRSTAPTTDFFMLTEYFYVNIAQSPF